MKLGAGTLMLGGGNNYSAGTTIRAGTLEALSPGSLPYNSTPGMLSVASGATLAVNTSFWLSPDIQALTGNTSAFASGSALGFDTAGGDASYGYAITNNGLGIVKLGANTLTLTAANSYTGPTTISAGTLQFTGSGTLGTGDVTNNGALLFNYASGTTTVANNIAGTGTLTKSGTGTLVLSGGSLSYTGRTTITAGTLEAVGAGGLGLLAGKRSGHPGRQSRLGLHRPR